MQESTGLPRKARCSKRLASIIAMAAIAAVCQGSAAHAQCASGVPFVNSKFASLFSSGTTGPLRSHIGATCMDPTYQGAATACTTVLLSPNTIVLQAIWPSLMARTMDATGGCSFMCQLGDCFVGNTGLPVELLSFGVE